MNMGAGGKLFYALFILAAAQLISVTLISKALKEESSSGFGAISWQLVEEDNNDEAKPKLHRHLTLQELSGNPPIGTLYCPSPLLPVYDRVLNDFGLPPRKIPRTIHVSMKSRCVPPDIFEALTTWKDYFPFHSFYFHDDQAVDRLFEMDWTEFPQLHQLMRCVRVKGAMKIDIWRMLIIYTYGGVYTDVDNVPNVFREEDSPIKNDDEAFFLTDGMDRPSQWFFAMEPKHPIAFFTIHEIFKRLHKLEKIERPKIVKTTGPDALKHGYGNALEWEKKWGDIWVPGKYQCKFNKTVTKFAERKGDIKHGPYWIRRIDFDTVVPWNATENITKRERIERQSGVVHWTKEAYRKSTLFDGSCMDYLYALEMGLPDSESPWRI
mmetsp:Transcript_5300/g.11298  ORF Transcript_5300/g.11298 Transcript_5300/m.11298 type:complete len:380 (-) Transcript_5300:115-1254(-)